MLPPPLLHRNCHIFFFSKWALIVLASYRQPCLVIHSVSLLKRTVTPLIDIKNKNSGSSLETTNCLFRSVCNKGSVSTWRFFRAEKHWWSAWQCLEEALVLSEKKRCVCVLCVLCVLSPWKQYLYKGRRMNRHCFVAFTVFCLKSFFHYEWASNGGSFPSYLIWMMSLIMILTHYHGCSEQTQIMEDMGA